tara:strand:- start:53 stop:229 length:177 start_codon:yes stop_codon:yes gene_type:complete
MKKNIWLLLSSFGIMFAVFSWLQESGLINSANILTWKKGVYALLTGFLLYYFLAKNID